MCPTPRQPERNARGFTVVELLVASVIMLLLLGMIGATFNFANKAVDLGTANSELLAYGRALETNLRDDFRRMSKDGFMVIKTEDIPYDTNGDGTIDATEHYAADQIVFFAVGPWTSAQYQSTGVARTFQADISRVWYGHLAGNTNSALPGSEPFDPAYDNTGTVIAPIRWPLGRQSLLISPQTASAGMNAAASIWHDTATVSGFTPLVPGTVDVTTTDMLAIRAQIASTTGPTGYSGASTTWPGETSLLHMADACFRVYGVANPLVVGSSITRSTTMLSHAMMVPNCSQFQVEYSNNGTNWLPSPRVTGTSFSVGYGNGGTAGTGVWPTLIRITATLHDSGGKLHAAYLAAVAANAKDSTYPVPTDGKVFQFVLTVPQ